MNLKHRIPCFHTNMNTCISVSYYLMLCILLRASGAHADKLQVGIIGAGIGGSATAYYIKSLLNTEDVEITVFESDKVGGRLATRAVGAHHYEVGGAIAINRNKYISGLLENLGLKRRDVEGKKGHSSLFDGQKIVFAENNWEAVTVAQLLWRYGFNMYRLNKQINKRLDLFDRIYDLQKKGEGFKSVISMLKAMDESFVNDLNTTTADGFKQDGLFGNILEEVIAATIRVNYGQHLNVHKFVGAVSVAGAGNELFAVDGGNWRVAQRLLDDSSAVLIERPVTHVELLASGQIHISVSPVSEQDPQFVFDAVVVAAPQTSDAQHPIKFIGFPDDIIFSGIYQRTVTTLVRGILRIGNFIGAHPYTDEIITTQPGGIFNSISRVYPVDSVPQVNSSDTWKVFSQRPLSPNDVGSLFENPQNVTVVDWLAYPKYSAQKRNDKFELSPNLYHLNAIEWAASAMEMSLISAKNIAILIKNNWCLQRNCKKIEATVNSESHTEL